MVGKLTKIIKPKSDEEKYLQFVSKFRKKYIPKRYNQIKLMDDLLNKDINHLISISNRSDGKSYNYGHFLLRLSIEYGIGFCFVVRHHTVQVSGMKLFQKIIDTQDLNFRDFQFVRTDFYIVLLYKDLELGIITDLNKATDLKYQSNYIENFPLIVYDEFLALEDDYLPDEWEKLGTIYSSIDRVPSRPLNFTPKVLYLGNAVNFSSPILANLEMFNILEKHKIGTKNIYGDIAIEIIRNDNANEQRNLTAFREETDNLTMAEFEVNNHNIATRNERKEINTNPNYIYVKLRTNYLKITYNINTNKAILSIVSYNKYYDFNLLLKDNKETSIYLDETYYDIDYERMYLKDIYLFDNTYSKNFIMDGFGSLKELRIHKIINKHKVINTETKAEHKEKVFQENYIENTKRMLAEKFML